MGKGIEIERRYLLSGSPSDLVGTEGAHITQGYAEAYIGNYTARLRSKVQPDGTSTYYVTHKEGSGLVRGEEEESLSAPVFNLFWPLTKGRRLEKTRRLLGRWEVDEFLGRLSGLWIAEIELDNEAEDVYMPPSIADKVLLEITEDTSFNNYTLSKLEAPPACSLLSQ